MSALDKLLDDWRTLPAESLARRLLLVALLAAGITMTAFGSMFLQMTGPLPFKIFPDVRPVLLLGAGLSAGLWAAGGGARRRKAALWTVFGFVVAFHLEEATVHWIGPFPGSITGTRVGLLGTAGSLLALAAVVLLHVEVESVRLKEDLVRRGAGAADAERATSRLARAGLRRVLGVAAGVCGIALLVIAGERLFGDDAAGGEHILLVGGALLLVLGGVLLRLMARKPRPAEPGAGAE